MPVLDVVQTQDKFALIPENTEVIARIVEVEYKSGPYKDQKSKNAIAAKKAGHVVDGKAFWSAFNMKFEVVAPPAYEGKEFYQMFFIGNKKNNGTIDQMYYAAGLPSAEYAINPMDTDEVVKDLVGAEVGLQVGIKTYTTKPSEDEMGNVIPGEEKNANTVAQEDGPWSDYCIYRPADVDVERDEEDDEDF